MQQERRDLIRFHTAEYPDVVGILAEHSIDFDIARGCLCRAGDPSE